MLSSISMGLAALRLHPMRTVLSTLGVVMGTGALVSVLAMGDGVERYAREQLARTTDLQSVVLIPSTTMALDGVPVPRPDVVHFTPADIAEVAARFGPGVRVNATAQGAALVRRTPTDAPRGVVVTATLPAYFEGRTSALAAGLPFTAEDVAGAHDVVVLSAGLAKALAGSEPTASLIGQTVLFYDQPFRVAGVASGTETGFSASVPLTTLAHIAPPGGGAEATAPQLLASAARVEDVAGAEQVLRDWAAARYGPKWEERVMVRSNSTRRVQAQQGLLIFKLLMGAITGVSLVVGGIGIMNVLLASVAERTREIGVRKAVGARNRAVLVQFLAESVAISGLGAVLGAALGIGVAFGVAALMRSRTNAAIYAAVTWPTLAVAGVSAVIIGVVFGLYPALRASRLNPVEAIRYE